MPQLHMGEVEQVIKHVDYQINIMIHSVTFVALQKCNFVFCFDLLMAIKKRNVGPHSFLCEQNICALAHV